ncbi:MAG: fumarate hydratase C-terminal domain-containing protein, partial [Chloroflexota bacterium]|nr:fumarate hydratase C-terminal domain-containing protein [Chloroflexota bacterium]
MFSIPSAADLGLREVHLTTPLSDEAVRSLRVGDLVYLTGPVYTARDGVYTYTLKEGHAPPIDLRAFSNVTLQSSPAGVEVAPGVFRISSLQATAGFRYAQYMDAFIARFGVKAVMGKAGMAPEVYQTIFRKHGAVYLSTLGYGLGAIYGRAVQRVIAVHWVKELGISEALWLLEVRNLGPLLVEGDTHGRSFFETVNQNINASLERLYQGLKPPIFR